MSYSKICYIIAEGFFFILSFFVGYILSFGLVRLGTIRFCARVGAHIRRMCSRSRGEDVTITDVIIKTPGDVNDVMPGSDGLRILGDFWKKAVSWDSDLGEVNWFLDLGVARLVGSTRCAARGGVRWNSQHSKHCVSLSSCRKPKSQEGNKSFVPEPREPSVFRVFFGFLCQWTFHVSVCFTDRYISYISMFHEFVFEYVTDPDHCRHAQVKRGRMTPTFPPFAQQGSPHTPTFCRILCSPGVFYHI